ncbi:GGDEF domain-containing protein [Christensenellaceae bacterium OttesenSCG-928-M15]|nr:GGDEF domain-containing protein [Christensenellaceae bacterium OttesenSCG-928-M15]
MKSVQGESRRHFNLIGEFREKPLEKQYFSIYMQSSKKSLGTVWIAIAVIYLAFGMLDMLMSADSDLWLDFLLLRAVPVLITILAVGMMQKLRNTQIILAFVLIVCSLYVVSYQWLVIRHMDHSLAELALSYMIIIFAVAVAPNRWLYSLLFGIIVTFSFLIIIPWYFKTDTYELMGIALYLFSAVALSAIFTYHLHVSRRMHFLREQQLELSSNTDRLTKIYNRQKFDEALSLRLHLFKHGDAVFSLIMFDLDDFKLVNDEHGHLLGDKVLVNCVKMVSSMIRGNDIFARWGGEEFMLLCPHTGIEAATNLAKRLLLAVDAIDTEGVCVTASYGVTQCTKEDTPESMVKRVDGLLYRAKSEGKNRVCSG